MYKILSWLALILWMGLIFFLSQQPATESNELSRIITEYIVKIVAMVHLDADFNINNSSIREYAHFLAYLILGILVTIILQVIGIRGIRGMGLALLLCVFYAVFDEIHQIFSPGRGIQLKDVFVDSFGAGVGIIIVWVIGWIGERGGTR
ncbi:VanZ family protein [Niallia endozanthoxylica]|uniref:VanZ family protein n=1 Tax=Niallia endozanthoxylica TaxID=2036016 RepID=A0A5J5GZM6_9BACI|nr:VanZ family protein [Niallia endozanthoxylica]KAA9013816.1 VanZ family protein [Niallia endozanthoxylica]